MTESERKKLTGEIHREIFRKISKDVHNVVADTINERLPEDGPETNPGPNPIMYAIGRERASWGPSEELVLRDEVALAIKLIATSHRRTPHAIRSRLQKMGIITDYSLLV